METALSISIINQQQNTLLLPEINQQLSSLLKNDWFEIDFWRHLDSVKGQAIGRNITWFVGLDEDEWVLRHYYRGGLVGKLLNDQYLFISIEKSRCYQELLLLESMYNQNLPVPKPIAGRVVKGGLFYRADLLIEKIPHSHDLVNRLQNEELTENQWKAIGVMIAKFHQAGIYHSDLNSHNILIDDSGKFWLIDFDKCERREINNHWQQANLDRLLRSFNKEKGLHDYLHFNDENWGWLMMGYKNLSQD